MQWKVVALVQVIQLKDLQKVAALGAGAFGQVFLVKHNSKYYALKCLSKALVMETGLQVWPLICHLFMPQSCVSIEDGTAN